ncbi:MAG: 4-alpha-glucanotransferase, partial [Oscillospiraceae bacterium]|nr:4-alpha-glucanotransferase [Oscillospiraceae bacterium]
MERAAGILMSLTSLPSPYGIGTMGKEARLFADFLHAAGQKVWQLLPVGPT